MSPEYRGSSSEEVKELEDAFKALEQIFSLGSEVNTVIIEKSLHNDDIELLLKKGISRRFDATNEIKLVYTGPDKILFYLKGSNQRYVIRFNPEK